MQDEMKKSNSAPLLEVKNLKKYFYTHQGILKAVDDVSFVLEEGKTLGIVGESGCGKTTCGRTCVGLYPKTDGVSLYYGEDIHKMHGARRRAFTRNVQTIFQDPYSSLDPRKRVIDIVAEGMDIHKIYENSKDRREKVDELLYQVGLAKDCENRYIHEFSGGQRQRIGIARALALNPKLLFCDEPVSALDVSVQAQIINLLLKLQEDRGLSYLFIAHDLSVVRHFSDQIAVMYLGKIVEVTSADELYVRPMHPYTKALISSIPIPDPQTERTRNRIRLKGDAISEMGNNDGCKYYSRCPYATEQCRDVKPQLEEIERGHQVACHRRDIF